MGLWDLPYTFPTELLSEIFLHLIASPSTSSPTTINTICHPLLVSHVCTHWRTAALTTPRLWARLFIQLSLSKAESQASLIRTWMERSGGCPLTVYVFWEEPPFAPSHPALDCLVQHSARWKAMFFFLPFDAFRKFGKIVGKVPLLTELSLGTGTEAQDMVLGTEDDDDDDDDDESDEGDNNDDDDENDDGDNTESHRDKNDNGYQLEMFRIAPKLASLECVNLSPFLFTFPWRNLTNIPVMAVTIEECLFILHHTTSLQGAGFVFLATSSSPFPPIPSNAAAAGMPPTRGLKSIHHPSLIQLSILTSPWDESIDLTPLFPLLSLPNLHSLTICNLKSHFGTSGFTSFLSRLYCLQTLHLRKTALSDQNLVAGLRVVPSVERLVVHPLIEGHGPPSVTEVVFDELRWKSWVVDGEYTEPEDNGDDESNTNENEDGDEGANGRENSEARRRRKRSNSGLPLLPKLTSIEVKLDNTIADAFIHMVHSRRTSVHFPSKPYRYRKVKSTRGDGESEGESKGVIVATEDGEEEDGEDEEDIDKPSILEHVRIRYSEPLHPQFISEFEDLQRDGLKLELDYMGENGGIEFNLA
ncbi:hypothetical protein P691DRAFT_774823 [Macrolepiota fuliginosa MF-IS2]|uniref:F-box domain-containing protein n=1 Tax=Macrolepiota fuliginosa MF-IS2 TaxID=1400762 RepID=A0A9P5XDX1_9AGAR|nr:hypothetical protein P691DRAFT_774823 [Macrolepiota fuliginosa MF-IS2]